MTTQEHHQGTAPTRPVPQAEGGSFPVVEPGTHPDRYVHWELSFEGPVAWLRMAVKPERPFREGYVLKLNSYDLGVDLELADAVQRIRFEHPEVKVVVVTSANDRVFCAGANIGMLATSSHPFKVNFCKITNETRCAMEDASRHSGVKWIAALNGTASGGGYELALACDEIYLVDDGSSAVSLPEVPLLGVLPGTGGLTRLVDKRMVRRDLADVFSTVAEGVKGERAASWKLVDGVFPRSRFADEIRKRARALAEELPDRAGSGGPRGLALPPLSRKVSAEGIQYEHVGLRLDRAGRTAELVLTAPTGPQPSTPEEFLEQGSTCWALAAFRELDDALLQLRLCHEEIGLVLLRTRGDAGRVLAAEEALLAHRDHWAVREILLHMARVLRRLDLTGRSLFAVAGEGSCFAGSLLEAALAADRLYVLDDPEHPVELAVGPLSAGALPMAHGLARLAARFLAEPERAERLASAMPKLAAREAFQEGLATVAADAIDWEDTLRLAVEERASLSPDALTGMEASLRFPGPENWDAKIYGRLSAWQNWIFTRPNATGEAGALTSYGKPTQPRFDWRRT